MSSVLGLNYKIGVGKAFMHYRSSGVRVMNSMLLWTLLSEQENYSKIQLHNVSFSCCSYFLLVVKQMQNSSALVLLMASYFHRIIWIMKAENTNPLKTIFPYILLRYWTLGQMILFAVQLVDFLKKCVSTCILCILILTERKQKDVMYL